MQYNQSIKTICSNPATVTNGGTGTFIVDTRGFASAQIIVAPSAGTGATNIPTVLKLEHGDSTSAFGNLDGYVGGATNGFTIPTAIATAATAVQPYVLNVDMLGKKRFLKLSVSPQTTVTYAFVANLSRPATGPDSTAESIAALGTDGAHVAGTTTVGLVVGPGGELA
jgi:hypothetical protein